MLFRTLWLVTAPGINAVSQSCGSLGVGVRVGLLTQPEDVTSVLRFEGEQQLAIRRGGVEHARQREQHEQRKVQWMIKRCRGQESSLWLS